MIMSRELYGLFFSRISNVIYCKLKKSLEQIKIEMVNGLNQAFEVPPPVDLIHVVIFYQLWISMLTYLAL